MSPGHLAVAIAAFSAATCFLAPIVSDDRAVLASIWSAAGIATTNALLALLLAHIGLARRTTKAFFAAVLGGMMIRMCATLGGFIIGLKVLLLPPTVFAAALLIYTGIFIAVETALWAKKDFSKDRLKIS